MAECQFSSWQRHISVFLPSIPRLVVTSCRNCLSEGTVTLEEGRELNRVQTRVREPDDL